MCTYKSMTRWPDNLSRSTSSECIYVEPHPLSGHGSMLGAFLFYRAELFYFAGRITNPPWGAPLRNQIHQAGWQ